MKEQSPRKRSQKRRIVTAIMTVSATLVMASCTFWGFLKMGHYHLVKEVPHSQISKNKKSKQVIYPTIYIGGSGGSATDLFDMMAQVAPQEVAKSAPLSFAVDIGRNNALTISGNIAQTNHFPQIDFNTVKGTSAGESYSIALQKMMTYLTQHYRVPAINLVGFSSGGTGALYYMIDTGGNPNFPRVKKFVSLDGEYNSETPLQAGETLAQVLETGPSAQTPMYQYIAKHYQRLSSKTKTLLLMGDYNALMQTDGTVPWADGFSVYHFFKENGNPVTWRIYPSVVKHVADKNNPTALAYIKTFLFGKSKTQT